MRVTMWVETSRVGSRVERTVEIDDEDLEGLEGQDQEIYIRDYLKDELWDLIEWGWRG